MPNNSSIHDAENDLLKALVGLSGRIAFSEEKIRQVVAIGRDKETQIAAYNLCDGSRGQLQITREVGIDPGNFNRTLARWIQQGIVFRLGKGKEARFPHVYPLPPAARGQDAKKTNNKKVESF
jgi:hypothetical protein